jgi:hypothetical protein
VGSEEGRMTESTEVDPFVKRVVTVKPGDVVIFKYTRDVLTRETVDELTELLKAKMGSIPFILVDKDFDVTVLKQSSNGHGIHIA